MRCITITFLFIFVSFVVAPTIAVGVHEEVKYCFTFNIVEGGDHHTIAIFEVLHNKKSNCQDAEAYARSKEFGVNFQKYDNIAQEIIVPPPEV